jgi:hypothetical protein
MTMNRRRAPINSCLLLAIIALTSFVRAQPAPPAAEAPRGAAEPATAAYVVSVTFAENNQRMPSDEVVAAIAYAASDSEMLKRADVVIPGVGPLAEAFGPTGVGTTAAAYKDFSVFVGNATEAKDRLDVRVTTNRPGKKAEVEAAVRRAVESLTAKKGSKEEVAKRV